MIILAIETSCDDTCVAIVKFLDKNNYSHGRIRISRGQGLSERFSHAKILSNIVSSQVKIHRKWGGVYPTLAKREHQKNLPLILKRALNRAKNPKIDLIAVTTGPGLEPCLWVGVNFAKDLAKKWGLPLIPINHIEAHIYANFVGKSQISNFKFQIFPAICLVVSGGHTQLILMKNFGEYKILGETRDDAAGECFDKVAKILGLGYPGGPIISKLASRARGGQSSAKAHRGPFSVKLPRPMIYQKNYDFSFSGLKTAVLYNFRSQPLQMRKSKKYIQAMSVETQQAIIDVLIHKTLKAVKEYKAKAITLGGGVAANTELRKQFEKTIKKELPKTYYLKPKTYFCTDNAVMVAATAFFHWLKGETRAWKDIRANANLRIGQND